MTERDVTYRRKIDEEMVTEARRAAGFPIIPETVAKSKCPGCPLELPDDDLASQMRHMSSEHPEIIAERRAEAARWDGWEQD